MSCIVAIKYKEDNGDSGVVLTADTLCSTYRKLNESDRCVTKIIKKDKMLMACSGSRRVYDVIENQFTPKITEDNADNYHKQFVEELITLFRSNLLLKQNENEALKSQDFGLVLVYKGRIYTIYSDFSMVEATEYTVYGSGAMYGLGAVHALKDKSTINFSEARKIGRQAVYTASEFDFYVGSVMHIAVFKNNNEEIIIG